MSGFHLPGEYPGVRHLCTTRTFGNLSIGCSEFGDPIPARQRLATELGLGIEDLVMTGLVHGTQVQRVHSAHRGQGALDCQVLAPADAVFTTDDDLWLLMTSADCYPILVSGPECLGLAHAGWRGVLAGVLPALIRTMAKTLDLQPAELRAGIGPGIGAKSFQLGPVEVDQFREAGYGRELRPDRHVDLPAILARQAREEGLTRVHVSGDCTYEQEDRFFSYRREEGRTGRFGLGARLEPVGGPSSR